MKKIFLIVVIGIFITNNAIGQNAAMIADSIENSEKNIHWNFVNANGELSFTDFYKDEKNRTIAKFAPYKNEFQIKYFAYTHTYKIIELGEPVYKAFFATDVNNIWKERTPNEVRNGKYKISDIVFDDKDPIRVFVSLNNVDGLPQSKILFGVWDPYAGVIVNNWTDMSNGLSQLQVSYLSYQNGSNDVIYAGTDAGVYRWEKVKNTWIKYADTEVENTTIMSSTIMKDK